MGGRMPTNYSSGVFEQCLSDSGEVSLPWRACDEFATLPDETFSLK